jgi:hypothetical protein
VRWKGTLYLFLKGAGTDVWLLLCCVGAVQAFIKVDQAELYDILLVGNAARCVPLSVSAAARSNAVERSQAVQQQWLGCA